MFLFRIIQTIRRPFLISPLWPCLQQTMSQTVTKYLQFDSESSFWQERRSEKDLGVLSGSQGGLSGKPQFPPPAQKRVSAAPRELCSLLHRRCCTARGRQLAREARYLCLVEFTDSEVTRPLII